MIAILCGVFFWVYNCNIFSRTRDVVTDNMLSIGAQSGGAFPTFGQRGSVVQVLDRMEDILSQF